MQRGQFVFFGGGARAVNVFGYCTRNDSKEELPTALHSATTIQGSEQGCL